MNAAKKEAAARREVSLLRKDLEGAGPLVPDYTPLAARVIPSAETDTEPTR